MRGAFGLVSLLVVAAIGCWLFVTYNKPVLDAGRKSHDEAAQISGRENDGTPIGQTFVTDPEDKGGHLNDLLVKSVAPGGAMETYFGLKAGDQVTAIGSMTVRDLNDDSGLARAMMEESYQRRQPLVVLRNGTQLTLPADPNAPAPSPSPTPAPSAAPAPVATPASTAPPATQPKRRGIYDQLDLIRQPQQDQ
jgi:hypothetical protein